MKSLTVLVCVFGLGLSRPSAQNFGGQGVGAASLRSAPSRSGPALISRPLNSAVGGAQSSLPLTSAAPAFKSRGISRAFTGPGGVVSSSGGLVSSKVVAGAQASLPLTPVTGLTGRVITRPVSSSGLASGARVVSGPGSLVPQSGRFVSAPGRVSSVSAPVTRVAGPGLGVAAGPLVSPVPRVSSPAIQAGPVSPAGPALAPVPHPAAHNVGPAQPAVHHSAHGGLPEPVQHNTVHSSISSAPSIVHNTVHSAPVVTEVHHGVHEGGHDGGYDEKPDPFHFEYGVHDDKYYTDFSEQRSGDEYGNIVGEYQVALPDGRIQYVKYTADGNYGGTTMEVSYKGEARHPEHSSHNVIHESSGPIIHEGIV